MSQRIAPDRNAGISALSLASHFILIGLLLDEDFEARVSP